MQFKQTGDTEYFLIVEEKIRECLPAKIGSGVDEDGKKIAGILLDKPLEDKQIYIDIDVKSQWEAANDPKHGIEKIFLHLDFVGIGKKLNFYFDLKDPYFRKNMISWFSLIILKNGVMGLCDGELPSVLVENVPLDMPKMMIQKRIYKYGSR